MSFTALTIALCLSASTVMAQPTRDAESALRLFHQAYHTMPSAQVEFMQSSLVNRDAQSLKRLEATPGLTTTIHPETKAKLYDLMRGRVLFSAPDHVRIEREQFGSKGWSPDFTAQHTSLWAGEESASFSAGSGDEAVVKDVYAITCEGRLAARKKGQLLRDFLKVSDCFNALATWVADVSDCARDLKLDPAANADTLVLVSDEMGLRYEIDPSNGELRSVEYRAPGGAQWGWRFEGTLAGPLFPARHPRLAFRYFTPAAGPRQAGDVITYQSVSVVPVPPEKVFRWTSLAPFAYKADEKVVVDANGVVNQKRTRERLERQPPTMPPPLPSSSAAAEPPTAARRFVHAGGAVVIVAVVGFFVRRRMA